MNEKEQEAKYDLQKRQEYTFQAAVENAKQANMSISASQNWLLILGLAEMSFLGTLLINEVTGFPIWGQKIILVALLIAFILFVIGSVFQYRHSLRNARFHHDISNKALKYINRGERFVSTMPEELKLPERQIKSCGPANWCMFPALLLVMVSTLGIIYFIIKM